MKLTPRQLVYLVLSSILMVAGIIQAFGGQHTQAVVMGLIATIWFAYGFFPKRRPPPTPASSPYIPPPTAPPPAS